MFRSRGTTLEQKPPGDDAEPSAQETRKRRIFSKPFVVALAALGSIAFAAPALAAGSSQGGPTTYYAQTGLDGIIHCARSWIYLGTGSGIATVETQTLVQRDLYCVNLDSYPNNYFAAASDLVNDSYTVCQSTPWVWNNSPSGVIATGAWYETQCPSSRYFALGFSHAEVNLGWRDNTISPNSWVTP